MVTRYKGNVHSASAVPATCISLRSDFHHKLWPSDMSREVVCSAGGSELESRPLQLLAVPGSALATRYLYSISKTQLVTMTKLHNLVHLLGLFIV